MMALELKAFDQCEADGVTGLSWKEVEDCEEKFCSLLAIGKNSYTLKAAGGGGRGGKYVPPIRAVLSPSGALGKVV